MKQPIDSLEDIIQIINENGEYGPVEFLRRVGRGIYMRYEIEQPNEEQPKWGVYCYVNESGSRWTKKELLEGIIGDSMRNGTLFALI